MTVAAAGTLASGLVLSIIATYTSPTGILVGIPMFLAFCITAYNVNCASVGHCDTWATIIACFYAVYALLSLALLFITGPEEMKKAPAAKGRVRR